LCKLLLSLEWAFNSNQVVAAPLQPNFIAAIDEHIGHAGLGQQTG
jgi:hypothetical protein